jgi:hypothetical protein
MSGPITQQQLIDAGTDADSLAAIANGDDNTTVTTRLGQNIPPVAKAIKDAPAAIANAGIGDAAAALINQRMFRSGTLAQRGPTPFQNYPDGLYYYVTDLPQPRGFTYVYPGSKDQYGVVNTADNPIWVGWYTPGEIKNLAIDPSGQLPQANVAGLGDAFSAYDSGALSIKVRGFRAAAASSVAPLSVVLSAQVDGPVDHSVVSWAGYSVLLGASVREFIPPNWSASTSLFVAGNSLSDVTDVNNRWSQIYAAAKNLQLYSAARYSSDGRQPYRSGALPLDLTITDANGNNVLPAGGTKGNVTAINGTTPDGGDTSILTTGDAGLTTGVTMPGTLVVGGVGLPATLSVPNAGSTVYSIQQNAGQPAVALTGPVRFVPYLAGKSAISRNVIWDGNNDFYSGVANRYGDFTNPDLWDKVLTPLVNDTRGQQAILLPIIPDSGWPVDGSAGGAVVDGVDLKTHLFSAMSAANARTETLWPDKVARDAQGRTLLQRLQAGGNGSANDNADIANGLVPRSLHRTNDTLHLNSAGDAIVAQFVDEAFARMTSPPAITADTLFAWSSYGTNPRTAAQTSDVAVSGIRIGVEKQEMSTAFVDKSIASLTPNQAAGVDPILAANTSRHSVLITPPRDAQLSITPQATTGRKLYANLPDTISGVGCPSNALYVTGLSAGDSIVLWES